MPRRRRTMILHTVFLSLVGVPTALAAGPPINLNIRRKAATTSTNTAGSGAPPPTSTQSSSASATDEKKDISRGNQWGGVALDLAGEFSCHVASPRDTSDLESDGRMPLFRLGRSADGTGSRNENRNGRIPSIHVGGRYDFSKVWYGATRIFGSLSWHGQRVRGVDHVNVSANAGTDDYPSTQTPLAVQRMRDNLSRCTITFRTEKDILKPQDGAAQLCLKKRLDRNDEPYSSVSPSLTLRVETNAAGDSTSVALRTPIHRRVDIISKSTVFLGLDGDGDDSVKRKTDQGLNMLASRLPRSFSRDDWETGSWLPDIRLSPTGWLAARSEVGLPPLSPRAIKTGVRLSVNRQVPWSLWGGTPDDDEEHNTWVRVQFCGTSPSGDAYYSASIDAAVERIVDSARITLAQEQIVRPTW